MAIRDGMYNAVSMDVRRRRIPYSLLGAVGLFAGLLIAAGLSAPRASQVSPAPDARHVSLLAPIKIEFSRPMDHASVESRLSITPLPLGTFTWEDTVLVFQPEQPWPEGTEVHVRLAAGAQSRRFLPMFNGRRWSFTVGTPRIVYLWPADGPADIYARSPDSDQAERLTESPHGVHDYSLSSDGSVILYVAERPDGGTDLRRMDIPSGEDLLLLECPQGYRCEGPRLSPSGELIAFERIEMRLGKSDRQYRGPSQVMVIEVQDGGQPHTVAPPDHISSSPRWSAQGWLAYYDNTMGAIVVTDHPASLNPPQVNVFPSDVGEVGSWSPDGCCLVYPDMVISEEEFQHSEGTEESHDEEAIVFYGHLYRAEVVSGAVVDLSAQDGGLVEDASAVHSPNGAWIAFARKYLDAKRWTLGRQIWLMRADGLGPRQLTDDPAYNHSALAWSPDTAYLVHMRFNQAELSQPSEIWLLEVEGGESRRLVTGGYMPGWIP